LENQKKNHQSVKPSSSTIDKLQIDNEYSRDHPKQIAFLNVAVKTLIIDCGLPFDTVEQPGFVEFKKFFDKKIGRIYRHDITEKR
jgi:hypothetical protein